MNSSIAMATTTREPVAAYRHRCRYPRISRISVGSWDQDKDGGPVQYLIQVGLWGGGVADWTIARRFSEFDTLRKRVRCSCTRRLQFPRKCLGKANPEKRMAQLNAYLRELACLPLPLPKLRAFHHFVDAAAHNDATQNSRTVPSGKSKPTATNLNNQACSSSSTTDCTSTDALQDHGAWADPLTMLCVEG